MFPLAKAILKGALARDECRGAHYKPDFDMPGIARRPTPPSAAARPKQWCDRSKRRTASGSRPRSPRVDADGEPQLTYEDVDTSLIPPRPRLYGLVGAEVIEEVWKDGSRARSSSHGNRPHALQVAATVRNQLSIRQSRHTHIDHPHLPSFEVRILRQDAPGKPQLLGAASGSVRGESERHQRAAEDRGPGHDRRRQEGRARRLGLQLPGRSLRRVHDGHQRPRPAGLLGAGRSLLDDQPGEIELRPMTKFPVLRDLCVDRSRLFRALEKVKAWIPVDGYYDRGPGPRESPEAQEMRYPLTECMSCGCCLEACPQYVKIEVARRDGESDEDFAARKNAAYDEGFVGAARDQPGDALQRPRHRPDERRRAARSPDGRGRHSGLRQRPELRRRLPEEHPAHPLDRPRRPRDDGPVDQELVRPLSEPSEPGRPRPRFPDFVKDYALTREQSRQLDRRAIDEYGISGLVLMENAGRGTVDVLERLGISGPVVILCGKGNNAGDGFVIARHLEIRGHACKVILLSPPSELTGDAATNFAILEKTTVPIVETPDDFDLACPRSRLDCRRNARHRRPRRTARTHRRRDRLDERPTRTKTRRRRPQRPRLRHRASRPSTPSAPTTPAHSPR